MLEAGCLRLEAKRLVAIMLEAGSLMLEAALSVAIPMMVLG
jgi:hypothetical protein